MSEELRRGTSGDDIRATPSGSPKISSEPLPAESLKITLEPPLPRSLLPTREHIEGHLSALRSLAKEHNSRGNISPIHLSFGDGEDRTRVRTVVTGKEIVDADLKRPFKEATRKTILAVLIRRKLKRMAYAGMVSYVPANLGWEHERMVRKPLTGSEEAFTSTGLPKGEASEAFKKSTGPINRREYRFYRAGYRVDR
ncbi:hypothetical protein Tco_0964190 [Tanacetum coccineum]